MNEDEEILQDFLIEAGEILEQVSNQLIELEHDGGNHDLLNGIFRGFHTVKGGASFLGLNPLVEVCHRAEDVFNALRQGERSVDADLMDVVLRALDTVNTMFEAVRAREALEPADPELLTALEALLSTDGETPSAPEQAAAPDTDPADAEFEAMLEAAQASDADKPHAADDGAQGDSDDISDAEFERLLDTLHGPGAHQGVPPSEAPVGETPAAQAADGVNDMTEDEFDALLDQLHGKNGAPGQQNKAAEVPPATQKPHAEPAKSGGVRSGAHPRSEGGDASIRVSTRRLDEIMNLVGELVLVRNRLSTLKTQIADERVTKAVFELDAVTMSLQDAAMQTRMQPVRKVFGRFPRVVRDLARHLKKEVALELHGEDTDLDKNLVEALADPLVHLVRNAVDHGIEYPDEREAAGKPRQGKVVLSAEQEGDHILLVIRDDGAGMDPQKLRARAVEKNLLSAESAERLSDREAFDLIFAPGFSTRTEVSDVSGRGVGMDVVKTSIGRLNGKIEIQSELGQGSTIRIQVPLTLAILPTMMVGLGDQRFALPLACVGEIFNLDPARVRRVEGREVVLVRDRAIPLFRLNQWLSAATTPGSDGEGHVVLVSVGHQRAAFVVDTLLGQEEVVIKPLGAGLHGLSGFAGATITGDGGIALIIDVAGLLRTVKVAA